MNVSNKLKHYFVDGNILKSSALLSFNTIANAGLSALFWWISTQLFLSEVVGKNITLISLTQLLTTIAQFGLGYSVIRFLPTHDQKNQFLSFIVLFTSISAMLLSIAALLVGQLFSPGLSIIARDPASSFLFISFTAGLALYQLLCQVLIACRLNFMLLSFSFGVGFIRILSILIFSKVENTFLLYFLFMVPLVLAVILLLGICIPAKIKGFQLGFQFSLKQFIPTLRYSLGSFWGNFFHDVPGQVLPQIIGNRFGDASVAHFYVPWQLFWLLSTLSNSIAMALFVEGSHSPERLKRLEGKTILLTTITAIMLAFGMIATSHIVLGFFGLEYAEYGSPLLFGLALAVIPASIVYVLVSSFRVRMRLGPVMLAYIVTAVLSLSLIASPVVKNVNDVGWIWLIAQVCAMFFLIYVYRTSNRQ